MNSIYLNMCCHLYTIPSNFNFYFAEVADSYIQISSGFVQLATVENTELDKYVHYEIIVTIHETLLNEYWSIFNSVLTSILVWICLWYKLATSCCFSEYLQRLLKHLKKPGWVYIITRTKLFSLYKYHGILSIIEWQMFTLCHLNWLICYYRNTACMQL